MARVSLDQLMGYWLSCLEAAYGVLANMFRSGENSVYLPAPPPEGGTNLRLRVGS